jgi:hypothetical protein
VRSSQRRRWAPSRTIAESARRWENRNGGRPECLLCTKPAAVFNRYCRLHLARFHMWGSPTLRPRWTGTTRQRVERRREVLALLAHERDRGNPAVRRAIAQVERWVDDARSEYQRLGADGVRRLPVRARSWTRLWFRIGRLRSSPLWVLAQLLLIASPELTFDSRRPEGRSCTAAMLLSNAANRRHLGKHPRGSLPPIPKDGRNRERIIDPRATAAIGRRVLRALDDLVRLYVLHRTEKQVGRRHPRRPPYALETPPPTRPQPRRVWSHLERRYVVAA